jgi:hypothetical protein
MHSVIMFACAFPLNLCVVISYLYPGYSVNPGRKLMPEEVKSTNRTSAQTLGFKVEMLIRKFNRKSIPSLLEEYTIGGWNWGQQTAVKHIYGFLNLDLSWYEDLVHIYVCRTCP